MEKISTLKKATRAQALETLMECYHLAGDNIRYQLQASIEEAINFFAPPLPRKISTVQDWVVAAVAKDGSRGLNRIHTTADLMLATDGTMLHACPIPSGFDPNQQYAPRLDKIRLDKITAPDFARVIAEHSRTLEPVDAADIDYLPPTPGDLWLLKIKGRLFDRKLFDKLTALGGDLYLNPEIGCLVLQDNDTGRIGFLMGRR